MQGAGPTPPDELLQRESQANSFVTNMATSRVRVQLVREWQSDLVCWGRAPTGSSIRARMSYFGILEDTLLGRWLPAYTKRPKGHLIGAPKFYFADVGVVNQLARRGTALMRGSELYGKAFENWVSHELAAYNPTTKRSRI